MLFKPMKIIRVRHKCIIIIFETTGNVKSRYFRKLILPKFTTSIILKGMGRDPDKKNITKDVKLFMKDDNIFGTICFGLGTYFLLISLLISSIASSC